MFIIYIFRRVSYIYIFIYDGGGRGHRIHQPFTLPSFRFLHICGVHRQPEPPPRGMSGDPNEEMPLGRSWRHRQSCPRPQELKRRHGNHGIQKSPKNEDPMSQISENCPQFWLTLVWWKFLAMGQPLGRPHLVPVAPSPEGISPFLLHHPHGDGSEINWRFPTKILWVDLRTNHDS